MKVRRKNNDTIEKEIEMLAQIFEKGNTERELDMNKFQIGSLKVAIKLSKTSAVTNRVRRFLSRLASFLEKRLTQATKVESQESTTVISASESGELEIIA